MKRIILYWIVIALIGILIFPAFQGNAQSNSNQLIFDTLIIYEHYGILMCIDTINGDTAFYTADGLIGKYADLDSAHIDTIIGYLKGKADSAEYADSAMWADSCLFADSASWADSALFADSSLYADSSGWTDLLDGYSEDYFLDTNFWSSGNVIFVPFAGNIQTYIDNADSGSTLILASGVYTITDTLIVDKQLNIRGQGGSGFVTTPVTPSHGTLITSSTANMVAFQINNDNVRISDLSINLTGAASTGAKVANNLQGVVFNDIDVIVNSTGDVKGFDVKGSDVVMRDLTFYITSSDASSAGVYFWNNNTTTRDAVIDCYNVTGTVVGAATYAYAFACYNINDANTLTLNLSASVCKALTGTPLDIAVISTSTTTNNSTVNAYMCTFDGADYDGYQTGSNELNLGGSNMVNNLISGTVTYRATMISDAIKTNYVAADFIAPNDSGQTEFTDDVVFDSTLTVKRGSFETLIFNTSGYAQWRPTPANGASEQIVTDARFIPPIALYDSLLFDSIKVGIFTWGNDSIRLDSVEMAIGHLDGTSANTFRFDANGFKIGYYVTGDTIIALSTGNGKYELGNDYFSTMSWFMYNWDAAPSAVQLYPILVYGHYYYK